MGETAGFYNRSDCGGGYLEEIELKKLPGKRRILLIGLSFVVLLGSLYYIALGERGVISIKSIYRWLLYIPATVGLIVCLIALGDKWAPKKNGFWTKIGALSLEIYLVHITLLHPLKQYGVMDAVGCWLYLILPVISIIIACCFAKLGKIIITAIEGKKGERPIMRPK